MKGMEWPYVVVLGAHDGLMPHALADDIEEERRIFHVAITRGDTAVHVIADATARRPFLDELARSPRRPNPCDRRRAAAAEPRPTHAAPGPHDARRRGRAARHVRGIERRRSSSCAPTRRCSRSRAAPAS